MYAVLEDRLKPGIGKYLANKCDEYQDSFCIYQDLKKHTLNSAVRQFYEVTFLLNMKTTHYSGILRVTLNEFLSHNKEQVVKF